MAPGDPRKLEILALGRYILAVSTTRAGCEGEGPRGVCIGWSRRETGAGLQGRAFGQTRKLRPAVSLTAEYRWT